MAFSDDDQIVATPCDSGTKYESFTEGDSKLTIIHKEEMTLQESNLTVFLELTGAGSVHERSGVDIVAVLDVSEGMAGEKLSELKNAMKFLIDKLCPADRLSIITFSKDAKRLCTLRQMTVISQAEIVKLVDDLDVHPGKDITSGLKIALQVIKYRSYSSERVPAIILMSDGNGSQGSAASSQVFPDKVPVYTFGIGYNQNPSVLNAISRSSSGGTFSMISSDLSSSFSQCLAELLGVCVEDLKLTVRKVGSCEIKKVVGGNYPSTPNKSGGGVTLTFGNLNEMEIRRVKVEVHLQSVSGRQSNTVLQISYSYRNAGKLFESSSRFVTVARNPSMSEDDEQEEQTDKPQQDSKGLYEAISSKLTQIPTAKLPTWNFSWGSPDQKPTRAKNATTILGGNDEPEAPDEELIEGSNKAGKSQELSKMELPGANKGESNKPGGYFNLPKSMGKPGWFGRRGNEDREQVSIKEAPKMSAAPMNNADTSSDHMGMQQATQILNSAMEEIQAESSGDGPHHIIKPGIADVHVNIPEDQYNVMEENTEDTGLKTLDYHLKQAVKSGKAIQDVINSALNQQSSLSGNVPAADINTDILSNHLTQAIKSIKAIQGILLKYVEKKEVPDLDKAILPANSSVIANVKEAGSSSSSKAASNEDIIEQGENPLIEELTEQGKSGEIIDESKSSDPKKKSTSFFDVAKEQGTEMFKRGGGYAYKLGSLATTLLKTENEKDQPTQPEAAYLSVPMEDVLREDIDGKQSKASNKVLGNSEEKAVFESLGNDGHSTKEENTDDPLLKTLDYHLKKAIKSGKAIQDGINSALNQQSSFSGDVQAADINMDILSNHLTQAIESIKAIQGILLKYVEKKEVPDSDKAMLPANSSVIANVKEAGSSSSSKAASNDDIIDQGENPFIEKLTEQGKSGEIIDDSKCSDPKKKSTSFFEVAKEQGTEMFKRDGGYAYKLGSLATTLLKTENEKDQPTQPEAPYLSVPREDVLREDIDGKQSTASNKVLGNSEEKAVIESLGNDGHSAKEQNTDDPLLKALDYYLKQAIKSGKAIQDVISCILNQQSVINVPSDTVPADASKMGILRNDLAQAIESIKAIQGILLQYVKKSTGLDKAKLPANSLVITNVEEAESSDSSKAASNEEIIKEPQKPQIKTFVEQDKSTVEFGNKMPIDLKQQSTSFITAAMEQGSHTLNKAGAYADKLGSIANTRVKSVKEEDKPTFQWNTPNNSVQAEEVLYEDIVDKQVKSPDGQSGKEECTANTPLNELREYLEQALKSIQAIHDTLLNEVMKQTSIDIDYRKSSESGPAGPSSTTVLSEHLKQSSDSIKAIQDLLFSASGCN